MSLTPLLAADVYRLVGFSAKLNYGVDAVRFPAPVRVGRRVRDRVSLGDVVERPGGVLLMIKHVVEIDREERPACVADALVLVLP